MEGKKKEKKRGFGLSMWHWVLWKIVVILAFMSLIIAKFKR